MAHYGHHHIVRSWKKDTYFLRIVLAVLLPIAFFLFAGLYLHLSLLAIAEALGISLIRLFIAYGISLIVGVAIAVLVGRTKNAGEAWMTVFDVAQNIPSFALIPLFILAMGYSNLMIVTFAATSIVWPILFSTLTAIRAAHPSLNEAATLFGAVGGKRIRYFLVPLSYPAIITGSIVGISIGWEAVIGAEIIGSLQGIGFFLNSTTLQGQTMLTIAGLAALLLVVFIMNRIIWSPLLQRSYEYNE